jgi:hypothetical protein
VGRLGEGTSYGIDRKLGQGEVELGVALVKIGLQPLAVIGLFSNRGAKLAARDETRAAQRWAKRKGSQRP